MISDKVISDAIAHAKVCAPQESCGLVVNGTYIACRNIAIGSEHFVLNPVDYVKAEESGEVQLIVHSHVNMPPEPSQADLIACERSGKPWLIVSVPTEAHRLIQPSGYVAPYVGREFVHGVCDCYSLARDWYARELGIILKDYPRHDQWWETGEDLYMKHFAAEGFVEVRDTPKRGDSFLMMLRSSVVNHAAVYLGDGKILHHVQDRLSRVDVYGGLWQKITVKHIRHESLL